MDRKREISLQRAEALHQTIEEYLAFKDTFLGPAHPDIMERNRERKQQMISYFGATNEDWNDWVWQLRHRISDVEMLSQFVRVDEADKQVIREVSEKYRWAATPYFISLMDPENKEDAINQLAVPSMYENDPEGVLDPMGEEYTSPAPCITRRYPNRLIINVTSACASFCRHCQRRRLIGETDNVQDSSHLNEAIAYIRENREIRDVLITGGDPFMLRDEVLEGIISRIRDIPHVEIIRVGTRTPAAMPQRVTDDLVNMLKQYHPLYVNIQFDHPRELTLEAVEACRKMADAGIPLGNQMVLLNGVNNDKHIVMLLNELLVKARVRPYYIFHPKQVKGTRHFACTIEEGLAIMDYLRGRSSGLSIPQYIVNAPGGLGKTPLLPDYVLESDEKHAKIRTWENVEVEIIY